MPLSSLRDDCRKQAVTHIRESRRFESMYALQGKPNKHATHFPCSVRVRSRTIHISRGPHIATLRTSSIALDRVTAPEKKGTRHNPQHVG
jgi:hypothetical protein